MLLGRVTRDGGPQRVLPNDERGCRERLTFNFVRQPVGPETTNLRLYIMHNTTTAVHPLSPSETRSLGWEETRLPQT